MLKIVWIVFLVFLLHPVFAQESKEAAQGMPQERGVNDTILMHTALVNGERIPWTFIRPVEISKKRVFSSPEARARYLRLRHNVIKVLPYAQFAQDRYAQLHDELAMTTNRRSRRQLVRACEQEIKDMFNKEVKNLTVSQGKILIKLIDRQTGYSSYEVVKELRGGVTAFLYQSMARVFGHNLKSQYDPEEDREIENIIQSLGALQTFSRVN